MRIFTNREEVLEKPLQVFTKMNYLKATQIDGNTHSLRPVKSRIGVLFSVQAEFVRGYCGQICISSPQQLEKSSNLQQVRSRSLSTSITAV